MIIDHDSRYDGNYVKRKVVAVKKKNSKEEQSVEYVRLVWIFEVNKIVHPVHVAFNRVHYSFEPVFLNPELVS